MVVHLIRMISNVFLSDSFAHSYDFGVNILELSFFYYQRRCFFNVFFYPVVLFFFFFNDPAPPEISPLPLPDPLPIPPRAGRGQGEGLARPPRPLPQRVEQRARVAASQGHLSQRGLAEARAPLDRLLLIGGRSEEHTSELQSQSNLVCRLLLEKKKHHT